MAFGVSRYLKGKSSLDFTETVSGSDISWGPHASLYLTPDRQPCEHPTTQVFYRPDAFPATQPAISKHWRQYLVIYVLLWSLMYEGSSNWCVDRNTRDGGKWQDVGRCSRHQLTRWNHHLSARRDAAREEGKEDRQSCSSVLPYSKEHYCWITFTSKRSYMFAWCLSLRSRNSNQLIGSPVKLSTCGGRSFSVAGQSPVQQSHWLS